MPQWNFFFVSELQNKFKMPGVTLSEKLAALSKRQEASAERTKLTDIISELAAVLVDSNWRDVPDTTVCHEIVAPLRDFLRRQAAKMDSDLVYQQLQLFLTPLEQANASKNDGVNTLQRLREQVIMFGNEANDEATKASIGATAESILNEYQVQAAFTKKVIKNTTGAQQIFTVEAMPAKPTFDFDPEAVVPLDIPTTIAAIDTQISSLVDQISSVQQQMGTVEALLTAVQTDAEITQAEFDRVKSSVTKQLNGKLLAVSQSIEFYDVVSSA